MATTQMVRGVQMCGREAARSGAGGVAGPGREGASGVHRAQRGAPGVALWGRASPLPLRPGCPTGVGLASGPLLASW